MSVRAYHLRREVYRKRSGAVSNPGDGSAGHKERRRRKRIDHRILLVQWDEAIAENNALDISKEQTNEAQ